MTNRRLEFTGRLGFDPEAREGLGEPIAYMVWVVEGHEAEAASLKKAFGSASAKPELRVRDGIVSLTKTQLEERAAQIADKPEHARTIEELKKALGAIERTKPQTGPAKKAAHKM